MRVLSQPFSFLRCLICTALILNGCANPKFAEMRNRISSNVAQDSGYSETFLAGVAGNMTVGQAKDIIKKSGEARTELLVYLRGVDSGIRYQPRDQVTSYFTAEQGFFDAFSRVEAANADLKSLEEDRHRQATSDYSSVADWDQIIAKLETKKKEVVAQKAEALRALDQMASLEPQLQKDLEADKIKMNLSWTKDQTRMQKLKQMFAPIKVDDETENVFRNSYNTIRQYKEFKETQRRSY